MSVVGRDKVLPLYRQLLFLSQHISDVKKRPEAVALVRDAFREHRLETDEERIQQLLAQAESRLSFLKMVTPREYHRLGGQQSTYYVYQNGKRLDDGSARTQDRARHSNWTGSNMDPDSVAKHQHLLNRAGFQDNSHAKGFF
uniref:Complex 1 LYR protein domain-containing protein n=1 Tax=Rhizochromulina marina TaxID=1034831 RepID=A0A7S2S2D5_9STRA|mmetsp:Transcript_24131/g.70791  ORF Transcript_24131/g.70791 Transcript_24131/m.70791 type:complete len:142 (+) Transcript_24131:3-428(+)